MKRGPLRGRLAEIPPAERPREKLLARGTAALSDEELLAVILGTGAAGKPVLESAKELLSDGGLPGLFAMEAAGVSALKKGIGPAKAARLAAVLEVARRLTRSDLADRDLLSDPQAAARFLAMSLATETREVMGGLFLDAKNRLLKNAVIFRGGESQSVATPSPLFRQGILVGATGVILYHNHPSGDPQPSAQDRDTTRRFVEAGKAIGIEVRDHLILARGEWFSFHRSGLMR